ncbi:acyl-CoA desaturase [Porticoccaceae bacterium LTM1]|nr:acyl-CoA desaturase [Porticoccaceae bacterium LTM1]
MMEKLRNTLMLWIDSGRRVDSNEDDTDNEIDWLRIVPFILMHLACFSVIWVGWSPVAVVVALFLYGIRMFAITAFYHRYFSHKSFQTSRAVQFIFAVIGAASVQRGPLWWAAHHRNHHANSDEPNDAHSPVQDSFWWSHMGWFLSRKHFETRWQYVKDWSRYPELVFLDRFDLLVPAVLAVSMYILGALLQTLAPALETSGLQMLVWGFFISTVVLYHATFTINSLAHRFGKKRYPTSDDSRNNFWLALLTFGEGWHNNHHFYPRSVRQGHRWWELDFTYAILKLMAAFGLVWRMTPVPERIRRQRNNPVSSRAVGDKQ